jgi:hypothetical protein
MRKRYGGRPYDNMNVLILDLDSSSELNGASEGRGIESGTLLLIVRASLCMPRSCRRKVVSVPFAKRTQRVGE